MTTLPGEPGRIGEPVTEPVWAIKTRPPPVIAPAMITTPPGVTVLGTKQPTTVVHTVAPSVWQSWTPWSECSVTCNGGVETRTRDCENTKTGESSIDCTGVDAQTQECNTEPCEGEICMDEKVYVEDCDQYPSCPSSCEHVSGITECVNPDSCVPGCRCPDNKVEQDGECVEKAECKCPYDMEIFGAVPVEFSKLIRTTVAAAAPGEPGGPGGILGPGGPGGPVSENDGT
ncbi:SCO-spondin-like [Saccoglossus kowalevskii]